MATQTAISPSSLPLSLEGEVKIPGHLTLADGANKPHGTTSEPSPDLPVAELETISLKRLYAGDLVESAKLFNACKKDGIFYLDLQHPDYDDFLRTADKIYALAGELFDLDLAEKLEYDVDKLGRMKLNG